jgi:molybdate transport repressor ModE-like protein
MSIRFDLTDLQLFLHVAEAGSITQGASRTNMTLASASERIRAMEDTLGIPLLERKRRGVQLTPSGSALEQHARIVMRQLEEMRGELNDFSKGLRCRVHILANTVATVEYLPPILATFLSVHPNIEIDLEERPSGDIIRAVAEGLADIGIVAEATNPADELETFPFAEDRLVLITPRRQVLGPRREIAFREVLDQEFIGFAEGSALQKTLNHHAARAGRRLKMRVRLNSFESVARMVERGVGLGVLPESVARRYQRSMAVRIVSLSDGWAARHFTVCTRRSESLPPHAKRLLEHLIRHSPRQNDAKCPE